ncbi:hypothetical protein F4776DRAFT_278586 [Hypoxylon sp. NC0597]|nr:hypothetical protein F4776DRAFT_278586 [Hypoxylon sp. NC0597]
MADYGSYKPPFRRHQATGNVFDSTEETVMPSDYQGQSSTQRANNRGGRGNMRGPGFVARGTNYGGRGGYAARGNFSGHEDFNNRGDFISNGGSNGRGGYSYGGDRGNYGNGYRGGRGRGYDNGYGYGRGRGRGGYSNNFFQGRRNDQQQDQPSDGSELYQRRDLENYFWGQCEDTAAADNHSTFHDSKMRPGELAYVQLFTNANPRWAADHIVFAKSNLKLLPEYSAKKAEHGEWEIPKATDAIAKDGEIQPHPAQTRETDDAVDADATKPATQGDEAGSASTVVVAETATKEDKTEVTTPTEATQDDEAPQPTKQPSPVSSSRMAFSDVRNLPTEELQRLEEEQRQQRLARQQQQQQQQDPVFPAIEPIDYIPGTHSPIAVFEERRFYYNTPSRFAFVGWYKVARVNILAPHSAELVRMQQQKWERRDRYGNASSTKARDAAAWNAALRTEWAVVKFEKLEGLDVPAAPAIEKLPERRVKDEPEDAGQQLAQTQAAGAGEGQGENGVNGEKPVAMVDAVVEADASLQDTVTGQLSKMRVEDEETKTGATAGTDKKATGDLTGIVAEASQPEGSDEYHDVDHVKTEQEDSNQAQTQENVTSSTGATSA